MDFSQLKGVFYLQNRKLDQAQTAFLESVEKQPLNPYFYMNLGLAYDLNKQPDKTLKKYKFVQEEFPSPELGFFTSFNQGELYSRLKNLEKALENYQQALAFQQEDLKVKQNIEFLFLMKDDKQKSKKDDKNQENKPQDQASKQKNPQASKDAQKDPAPSEKSLSKKQIEAILQEVERKEARIRARQFQKNKPKNQLGGKDW